MDLQDLIPHRPPILLIDQIKNDSEDSFETESKISQDTLLVENENLPTWALTEYMAQSIALYGATRPKSKDEKINKAFVIKIEDFKVEKTTIAVGTSITCQVSSLIMTSTLGKFSATTKLNSETIALGKFTVIYS